MKLLIMHENHKQSIVNIARNLKNDPNNQALILYGSVARNNAGKESDIDLFLLLSEEDYELRSKSGNFTLSLNQMCVKPCNQANITFISQKKLLEISLSKSEIRKYAFVGSQIIFSKIKGLENIIHKITEYPIMEKSSKLESFYSQIKMHHSYLEYGEYSGNLFVLYHSAVALTFFGGRMILAHNNMLYPGRKWFLNQLEKATNKPEEFMDRMKILLKTPSINNSNQFCECLFGYRDWPKPKEGWYNRFLFDSENKSWDLID